MVYGNFGYILLLGKEKKLFLNFECFFLFIYRIFFYREVYKIKKNLIFLS